MGNRVAKRSLKKDETLGAGLAICLNEPSRGVWGTV